MSKPRIVKDYDKLDDTIIEQIKLTYPYGFEKKLIKFTNQHGKLVSALPFETDEKYYLVRMTSVEAAAIIADDDDYDDDGVLKDSIKEEYQDKHDDFDVEEIPDDLGEDDDDDDL